MMQDLVDERAEQLLAMTQRLVSLLDEEVAALKARRLDASGAGWDEKEKLVHAWRLEVSRIKADPGLMAGAVTAWLSGRAAASHDMALAVKEDW